MAQNANLLRLHATGIFHRGIVDARQRTPVPHMLRFLMLIYDVLPLDDTVRHAEFL